MPRDETLRCCPVAAALRRQGAEKKSSRNVALVAAQLPPLCGGKGQKESNSGLPSPLGTANEREQNCCPFCRVAPQRGGHNGGNGQGGEEKLSQIFFFRNTIF